MGKDQEKNLGFVAELGVQDVKREIDFYVDTLGCELVEVAKDDEDVPFWAEISFFGSRLMFERSDYLSNELPGVSNDTGKQRFALVLRMKPRTSAKALIDRLIQRGCVIDTGPTDTDYGTYEFSFRDSEDYVIVVAGRD